MGDAPDLDPFQIVVVISGSRPGMTLERPAAIDDMCDAGGERAFVAGEIHRE
jgi:hypothetical protein